MNITAEKYVEVISALEENTPDTPYMVTLDEFTDNMSDLIKQAGRYVDLTFLGYDSTKSLDVETYIWTISEDGKLASLPTVAALEVQSNPTKTYYVKNAPDRMILNGDYYALVGDEYQYVENPENPDTFTEVEFANTNYPKYVDNPYIVSVTYFTINTTSDYENMFVNCENLKHILFYGPMLPRYSALRKTNLVVNCPKLKYMGIAYNEMNEVLNNQGIDSDELVLIMGYKVNQMPTGLILGKLGLFPTNEISITGLTDSYYVETPIDLYPFLVGNVTGSTNENPVEVVITDTENLRQGLVITD